MAETGRSTTQLEAKLDDMLEQVAGLKDLLASEVGRSKEPENLLLQSPVGLYVVKGGVFKFASNQMRRITGYSEHDLIGMNQLSLVHAGDRSEVGWQVRQLLRQGQSYVREYRIVTRDARVKWVMDSACLSLYEGGDAVVGNLVDITGHKEAEESALHDLEKYRDLCESASDMIQCVGVDGRILYVNRAWRETLGYADDEIGSLSIFDLVPADCRQQWVELLGRVASGDTLNDVESSIFSKKGQRVPIEGTINCRFDDNRPVYTRGIFRDVSKRREERARSEAVLAEAQEINRRLQQSNRELEEFAYIASHDLQEPLRKISSFGEILQLTLSDKLDEDQQENLSYMIDGARRMQSILDDLLSYSRITTAAKPSRYVDPNVVLENLKKFELAELLAETGGRVMAPKALSSVYGDQPQVHQLLQNLIANSLKFHKKGVAPTVMVSSAPAPNNMVRFAVEDNGIGIDPQYHEQIFLMFKRLHSARTYKGTGIGLAICKKIVQRHGGEIGVKSEEGKGTTFWFTLPALDTAASDRETRPRGKGA